MIRKLVDSIYKELRDARHYAMMALKHKETDHKWCGTFSAMSREEFGHAKNLHEMFREALDRSVAAGEMDQRGRDALYHWEHDTLIEEEAELNKLWDLIRK